MLIRNIPYPFYWHFNFDISRYLPSWQYFENHLFYSWFFMSEYIFFFFIVINIDLIFYLLNTALYNHIYSSIFVHMEDIFSPKTILKPNTSLFESLPLLSSEIFILFLFFICSLIFALRDFCIFRKSRPSVCIFNLTSASGEISVIIC